MKAISKLKYYNIKFVTRGCVTQLYTKRADYISTSSRPQSHTPFHHLRFHFVAKKYRNTFYNHCMSVELSWISLFLPIRYGPNRYAHDMSTPRIPRCPSTFILISTHRYENHTCSLIKRRNQYIVLLSSIQSEMCTQNKL